MYVGEEKGTAASTDFAGLAYAGMFDFFGELKRILVSLTDVASLVQHVSSEDGNEESDHMDTDVEEVQVRVTLTVISGMIRLRHNLFKVISHINLSSFSHSIQHSDWFQIVENKELETHQIDTNKNCEKNVWQNFERSGTSLSKYSTTWHNNTRFFLTWPSIFYFYV